MRNLIPITPASSVLLLRLTELYVYFLAMFAEYQKVNISFVMALCLSICPHGTTWHPLDGLSLNLIFDYFSKNCQENSSFLEI